MIFGRRGPTGLIRLAAALAAASLFLGPDAAAGPRVQVRGSSRLELQAFGPASRLTITGNLRDEVGAPVPRARLMLSAVVDGDVPVPWTSVHACGQPPPASFSEHADHVVDVDDAGTWCVVARLPRDHCNIRATFGGDGLHDGTRSEIVWDAAQRAMSLQFSPRPERLDLDQPTHRVFARVAVPPDVSASGLELTLKDERAQPLVLARTDDAGLAVFEVSSAALGEPGIGELHASFAGTATLSATSTSTSITRFAHVKLELVRDQLHGDPASGLQVPVRITTPRTTVSQGSVEALLGSDVVGNALVSKGQAEVPLVFAAPRGAESLKLSLRYVAASPYFVAAEPAQLTLHIVRPAVAWRLLPVLAAIGVAAWLLRGWRRPKRLERAAPRPKEPTGVASLEVVAAGTSRTKWTGRVLDAHDGAPIDGARVRVIAPSFVELDVVIDTHTDTEGRFAFELRSAAPEFRLRVESPSHADLDRLLPPASDLAVSLVSRRRMLLQRLVDWARKAGRPWDQVPEPTPGHVARVAIAQHRRDPIASWAEQVEQRAYGPEPVDARAEREVRAMEPGRQALR